MSRWGDYGRGGRVAADAAAATTLKSCMKDWGDVFWTLCETSRKDWMVTRLFDTLKMEPILNRVGETVGLDGIGTGLKGLSKAAVWVVGIVKKEPREKLKQATKSTVTIVKKATKSFIEKVTPYVRPVVDKSKEIASATVATVSRGIEKAWTETKRFVSNVVEGAVKTVSSAAKKVGSFLKSLFC